MSKILPDDILLPVLISKTFWTPHSATWCTTGMVTGTHAMDINKAVIWLRAVFVVDPELFEVAGLLCLCCKTPSTGVRFVPESEYSKKICMASACDWSARAWAWFMNSSWQIFTKSPFPKHKPWTANGYSNTPYQKLSWHAFLKRSPMILSGHGKMQRFLLRDCDWHEILSKADSATLHWCISIHPLGNSTLFVSRSHGTRPRTLYFGMDAANDKQLQPGSSRSEKMIPRSACSAVRGMVTNSVVRNSSSVISFFEATMPSP